MAHNLPARLTSFIGREREIREIGALLETQRLITLVGAPGVGKTRLSLQIAARAVDTFPEGVWLVELAPLGDPLLVPQAVADVLRVREQLGRPLTATLADHLRSRRVLLLLDNCEHLIGAVAALVETLVQACPDLHVLATSREPLTIEGEVTRRVPSLTVPDAARLHGHGAPSPGSLAESEAVRLFVERARAADAAFALTERTAPVVAQICARLDGIPLAIELAAARVRALSVEQIAARLDDRFRLLTGGSRTALPRQQTLRGAVDWSYDLLSEPEQALLRRLAVFAGGFTLDASEQMGRLDLLTSLVDKSLVQVEDSDGERRHRLLETFRQYGLEQLAEHGELAEARDHHRDYFLAFAEELAPTLTYRPDRALLDRLERERDNLRAALDWCLDAPAAERGGPMADGANHGPGGIALGVRLAAAIWPFWRVRGHTSDGQRFVERVLAISPSETALSGLSVRDLAPLALANLTVYPGSYRPIIALLTEYLTVCRETGDEREVVMTLHTLGLHLAHLGDVERGAALCQESIVLARRLGPSPTLGRALADFSIVAYIQKRYEQSIALAEELAGLCRRGSAVSGLVSALRTHSLCAVELGDLDTATRLAEEAFGLVERIGNKRGLAKSYQELGRLAMLAGDPVRAYDLLHRSFALVQQVQDHWLGTICISVLAHLNVIQGTRRPGRDVASPTSTDEAHHYLLDAVRLFAAADRFREPDGLALPGDVANTYDRDIALLQEALGEPTYSQARGEGRAMSWEQAVEYALVLTAPAESIAPDAGPGSVLNGGPEVSRLTPREREVAVLIAEGRTNREIAEELVLSERTVDSHVRNIMGKLEVNSRARIAAWAVQHGLGGDR